MPLRKSDFGLRKTGVSEITNTGLANAMSLTCHNIPGECGIRRGFGGVNILIIMGLSATASGAVNRSFHLVRVVPFSVQLNGVFGELSMGNHVLV